jgi:hypothetical protein
MLGSTIKNVPIIVKEEEFVGEITAKQGPALVIRQYTEALISTLHSDKIKKCHEVWTLNTENLFYVKIITNILEVMDQLV